MKRSEVAQSCLTLFDPMDCSLPGSIHEIFQARILEWVAISSPEDLPDPGSNLALPHCGQTRYRLSHQEALSPGKVMEPLRYALQAFLSSPLFLALFA